MGSMERTYKVALIAKDEALSNRIELRNGEVPVALAMPDAWTAANLTLLGSYRPDGELLDVYDGVAGEEVKLIVDAGQFIPLDPDLFAGFAALQLRSGTGDTPVTQADDRVIQVVVTYGT